MSASQEAEATRTAAGISLCFASAMSPLKCQPTLGCSFHAHPGYCTQDQHDISYSRSQRLHLGLLAYLQLLASPAGNNGKQLETEEREGMGDQVLVRGGMLGWESDK